MAKLVLSIEDLSVETFHTVLEAPARGTVIAAQSQNVYPECGPDTFYDPTCCSTHETACEGETCVVLSRCCPSNAPTCYYSTCQQTCRDCGGLSLGPCYPTEIC